MIRVYQAMIKASWAEAVEYRAQMVVWMLSIIFPLVMMAVWLALVDEVGPAAGWERADFVSYYVGLMMVWYLTAGWQVWDWDEDIRTGKLSVKLLKPVDPFHHFFTDSLGWKLFFVVLIVPLIVAGAMLSPLINYPVTAASLLAFVLSVVAGLVLNVFIGSFFGMIGFWSTQSASSLWLVWYGAGQFLSGFIAPLALFPVGFRQVAFLLPFRSGMGFPVEILMGQLGWAEIGFGFAVTVGWTAAFLVLYRVLWRAGVKRYEAVGA
jgi:ABC-2 type transport system permease protein